MSTDLVTDSGLLERLAAAVTRGVTIDERRQQRVSFVYGNLPKDSDMTRHDVEQVLNHIDASDGRG